MTRHDYRRQHDSRPPWGAQTLMADDVFITRQPIFDCHQRTVAYQMLFRCGRTTAVGATDATRASAQVINSAMNLLGLADLMDDHRVFVRVTPALLNDDLHELLPPGQAVLELDKQLAPDDALIAKCNHIRAAGYEIAVYPAELLAMGRRDLVQLADYLLVDFQRDGNKAPRMVESRGRQAQVLARNVETHEAFDAARAIGCELFQGFFFAKPHIVRRRNLSSGKRAYLRFLYEVNRPEIDLNHLEQVVKQDAALACKLLRYLNSALFGLPSKLSSIRQALALLGERPLRRWASLLALTHIGLDKAPELVHIALVRARFCELLADDINMTGRELDLFLMGLLSTLDAMLDMEMQEVVADLPLAEDIKAAMLSDQTMLGKVCALTIAYEQAHWTQITVLAQELALDTAKVSDVQNTATRWADQVMRV